MTNNNFENSFNKEEGGFNIKKEISYYLFFWPWFLLTIVLALLGSYTYLRYTPNIYKSFSQVQITKSDATSSFLTTEVTSLFGTRVNVDNDIAVITSNHILNKVVEKLNLQTIVTQVGSIKSKLIFNEELPFDFQFKDSGFRQWNLSIYNDSLVISNDLEIYRLSSSQSLENEHFHFKLNDSLSTNKKYSIKLTSLNSATSTLKNRISATASSKNGEIINLSISGTNKKRNDAVLNTLIDVLIEDRISDERQLSSASINFIDKRLEVLRKTIKSISEKTIEYQVENSIYDTEKQTSNTLSNIVKENEAALT